MQSFKTLAGIDVSAKSLTVQRLRNGKEDSGEFDNTPAGHRALIKWLGKQTRVCIEATGIYHLQLALALRAAQIEVMVLNPHVAKDFAQALANRSKTDKADAKALLEYLKRMEFQAWEAPRAAVLELRELGRRISELVHVGTGEKSRLHAKNASAISAIVMRDVKAHVMQVEKRSKEIEKAAVAVIRSDEQLHRQFQILKAVRGVGQRSAVLLLAELAVLDPSLTTKQLTAHAGLDPREYSSGSSVQKPPRISKKGNARIRAILYMNALVAIRHDRGAGAFYACLLARGKKPMQAIVAVMRKLLHGIWTALQKDIEFDSRILFAASLAQAESSDSAVAASQPESNQDHPKGRSEAKELRQQLEHGSTEATSSRRRKSKAA